MCQPPIIQPLKNEYWSSIALCEKGCPHVSYACMLCTSLWLDCSLGTSKLPSNIQNSVNMLTILLALFPDSVDPPTNCQSAQQIQICNPESEIFRAIWAMGFCPFLTFWDPCLDVSTDSAISMSSSTMLAPALLSYSRDFFTGSDYLSSSKRATATFLSYFLPFSF